MLLKVTRVLVMGFVLVGLVSPAYAFVNMLQQQLEPVDGPRLDERQLEEARRRLEAARPAPLTNPRTQVLSGKYLHRLTFRDETATRASNIEFSLFTNGESGGDIACWQGDEPTRFFTPACRDDVACNAKTSRMGSMLLSAKIAGKPISITHESCVVFEVTLQ